MPFTSYGTRRVPTTTEKRRTGKLFPARSLAPRRTASRSDRIRTVLPVAMQFATDLLRHCVTRSHRSKETGISEPKTSHRIAPHRQTTRFRTILPLTVRFATDLLRHCVTRSERSKEPALLR